MRYPYIYTVRVKTNKQTKIPDNTKYQWGCGTTGILIHSCLSINCLFDFENSLAVSPKDGHTHTLWPNNSTVRIIPNIDMYMYLDKNVQSSVLWKIIKLETTQCSPVGECKNKMGYIFLMEYYTEINSTIATQNKIKWRLWVIKPGYNSLASMCFVICKMGIQIGPTYTEFWESNE